MADVPSLFAARTVRLSSTSGENTHTFGHVVEVGDGSLTLPHPKEKKGAGSILRREF